MSRLTRRTEVHRARAVIVATNLDDTAVLTVLTVRQLAPTARVVAAVRKRENAPRCVRAGRTRWWSPRTPLAGCSVCPRSAPQVATVIEDLLTADEGMMIGMRSCAASEVGRPAADADHPVLAVVRDGRLLRMGHPAADVQQAGDRLVFVGVVPESPVDQDGRPGER